MHAACVAAVSLQRAVTVRAVPVVLCRELDAVMKQASRGRRGGARLRADGLQLASSGSLSARSIMGGFGRSETDKPASGWAVHLDQFWTKNRTKQRQRTESPPHDV